MHAIRVTLAFLSVVSAMPAALKPIDADLQPLANKAVITYKTTPQGDLKMNLYFPAGWRKADRRPAVVFFFGGSCATGSPAQFATTAEYFATRGLVAASAEYRIESIHHTPPERCAEDGKSAIRWLRMNARALGIDAGRLIAGGGSSGGSIAAFAAYNTRFEPDDEDASISSKPDALVLINPAFGFSDETQPLDAGTKASRGRSARRFHRQLEGDQRRPPAILFFGTEDQFQDKARDFARQLIAAGTRAEFYTAAGQQHAFFNRFPDSPWHALVLRQIDLFLASLGYLQGDPTIGIPANTTVALQKIHLSSLP
jgi:acetyl esterase